jgi:DHA2 family multidrug resistance protein
MATFMEVLDTAIANVSLRHIAGELSATLDESTWVLTSYLVSNAIVLPISGWLATVIGRKRFYMSCVAIFGVSSLLCGLAPSLGTLIFCRVLQGLGGGGLAPSEQSILADSFPPEKHGQAFALYGIAVVVAPTLGPTLGGWITDNYSWHWIFFINVPVCVLSLALSGWMLEDPPEVREHREQTLRGGLRFDYLGFLLVAVGLGCLQIVLDKGQEDDWFATDWILALSIVSVMSLAFLVVWELVHDRPIVDVPLFKRRNFGMAAIVMFVTGFILISTTQMLPQYLQTVMGYDATTAGLALTAGGGATLVCMPIAGALMRFVQPRYLIAMGLVIEAAACWHLSGFTTEISFSHAAWARVFQGVGLPFLFVPITTVSYADLPPGKSNNASALINAMRNLGGSFGISLAVTLLARRTQLHHARLSEVLDPFSAGYRAHAPRSIGALDAIVQKQVMVWSYVDVFWLLAVVALCVIPVTFLLRRVKSQSPAAH